MSADCAVLGGAPQRRGLDRASDSTSPVSGEAPYVAWLPESGHRTAARTAAACNPRRSVHRGGRDEIVGRFLPTDPRRRDDSADRTRHRPADPERLADRARRNLMVTYQIRVGGTLPPGLIESITQVNAVQPAGTTVEVDVPDETALWGLIDALRTAGIDLLEVRRELTEPPTAS